MITNIPWRRQWKHQKEPKWQISIPKGLAGIVFLCSDTKVKLPHALPPCHLPLSPSFQVSIFNDSTSFSVQKNWKKWRQGWKWKEKKEHPKMKRRGWRGSICRDVEAPEPQRWWAACSSEVKLSGCSWEKSVSPDAPHSTLRTGRLFMSHGERPHTHALGCSRPLKGECSHGMSFIYRVLRSHGSKFHPLPLTQISEGQINTEELWVLWGAALIDPPRVVKNEAVE